MIVKAELLGVEQKDIAVSLLEGVSGRREGHHYSGEGGVRKTA